MNEHPNEAMSRFAERIMEQNGLLRTMARKNGNRLPDIDKTEYH